jgi:uncharacterized protein YegP (UPF0339 family)
MKIHIKRSLDNQIFFTIHARNGKTIATSETYKRKSSAVKAAKKFIMPIRYYL